MNKLRGLILIPVAALIASCGSNFHGRARLALIDSLADRNPRAALAKLDSMNQWLDDASEAAQNYAALIRIKAEDKTYITHHSDSTINKLVSYYEQNRDGRLLPIAYYYAARICCDMSQPIPALGYFQKAEQAAKATLPDKRLLGKIYSQSAMIFNFRGFYKQSLKYYKWAYEIHSAENDTTDMILNLRDMGGAYWNLEKKDSAAVYYKKACSLAHKSRRVDLITDTSQDFAAFNLYNGEVENARKILSHFSMYSDTLDISAVLSIYSDLYAKTNRMDSAVICYKELLTRGNIYGRQGAYEGLAKYYLTTGENEKAAGYLDLYTDITDSIKQLNASEGIATALAIYNYEQREKENNALKSENTIEKLIVAFMLLACFTLIIFVLLLYLKNKHNADVMRLKDEKLTLLKNEMEKHRKGTAAENEKMPTLTSSEIYKTLLRRIEEWDITHTTLNAEEWNELDRIINNTFDNFRSNVLAIYRTSQFEYRVCMLIKLKISPVNIGRMTNHSKESITATRRRLYEKAFNKKGRPSDWDSVILSL